MILLFNGMQSSLSLIYDREMVSIKRLLTSPLPRWWLLLCKLLGTMAISVLQVYAFLAIAAAFGISMPAIGYVAVLPALGWTMLGGVAFTAAALWGYSPEGTGIRRKG